MRLTREQVGTFAPSSHQHREGDIAANILPPRTDRRPSLHAPDNIFQDKWIVDRVTA